LKHVRKRLTYANAMSSIAVFLLIGGGAAFAAVNLPANSVGSRELQPKAVKTGYLAPNAVRTGKVDLEAIKAGKLAKDAVPTNRLRDSAVSTDKIADLAVGTGKIGSEAVATGKIAPGAVDTSRLGDGAVKAAKLGPVATRKATVLVPKEARDTVAVSCLPGEALIGGGGGFDIVTAAPHPSVIMSGPNGSAAWRVRGFNPSPAFDRTLTVWALCLQG